MKKEHGGSSINQKIDFPYDPAIPLLSINPEDSNSKKYMHPMFISALFTIVKTWKQLKYL